MAGCPGVQQADTRINVDAIVAITKPAVIASDMFNHSVTSIDTYHD
jgi:hypothetical protein